MKRLFILGLVLTGVMGLSTAAHALIANNGAMSAPVEHEGLFENTNARRVVNNSTRPLNMTYHHIISRNMLWNFWAKVAANGELKYLQGMVNAVIDRGYKLPGAVARDASVQDGNGQVIEKQTVTDTMKSLLSGTPLNSPAQRNAAALFERMYQWVPGNIIHGPAGSVRADDPGEGFEQGAQGVVGAKDFTLLKKIYDGMERYRSMGPGKERIEQLKLVAGQYTQITGRNDLYVFDEKQWDLNKKTGKWRISQPSH